MINRAVVQAIMLYGSETWALPRNKMNKLKALHHRIARYLIGKHIKKKEDGTWDYPRSKEVLQELGLSEIEDYIGRRRQYLQEYTKDRNILQLCQESPPSKKVAWWDHPHQCEQGFDSGSRAQGLS